MDGLEPLHHVLTVVADFLGLRRLEKPLNTLFRVKPAGALLDSGPKLLERCGSGVRRRG